QVLVHGVVGDLERGGGDDDPPGGGGGRVGVKADGAAHAVGGAGDGFEQGVERELHGVDALGVLEVEADRSGGQRGGGGEEECGEADGCSHGLETGEGLGLRRTKVIALRASPNATPTTSASMPGTKRSS